MSALIEHARSAFASRLDATAHYLLSSDGLTANKAIAKHVKAELKRRASETIDDTAYLELLRRGEGRYTAARKLGIDTVAIARRMRIDQDFSDRVRVAEAESLEPIVAEMRKLASSGEKWAAQMLLERKNSEEFGIPDKKISVNHNHMHSLTLNNGAIDPIDQEILALEADLREQNETRALNAGSDVIDIEYEDTEEL